MKRNISLDAFRGLFSISVMMGHYFYWNDHKDIYPLSFILSVDFFFVLSGYVLSLSLSRSKKENDDWYLSFLKNRFIRIYPVYMVCAVVTGIFIYFVQDINLGLSVPGMFSVLMLGQALGFSDGSVFLSASSPGVAWSISAEIWVGALFFPVVYLFRQLKLNLILVPICFVLVIFLTLSVIKFSPNLMDVHYQMLNSYVTFAAVRCLIGFCIGFLVFYFSSEGFGLKMPTLMEFSAIFICVLLYFKVSYERHNEILAPILSGVLVYVFSHGKGIVSKRLLNNVMCDWLGRLSFSIYMVHPILISVFKYLEVDFNILNTGLYFMSCMLAAYVLHVFVEKPSMKYKA